MKDESEVELVVAHLPAYPRENLLTLSEYIHNFPAYSVDDVFLGLFPGVPTGDHAASEAVTMLAMCDPARSSIVILSAPARISDVAINITLSERMQRGPTIAAVLSGYACFCFPQTAEL